MERSKISGLKKNYFLRFQFGLAIALGATIAAFNFTTYPDPPNEVTLVVVQDDEDIPIVRTATEKPKELPPPTLEISDKIEPIPDIEFIEKKPVELIETVVEVDPKVELVFVAPKPKAPTVIKKPVIIEPDIVEPDVEEIKVVVDEMPRFNACEDLDVSAVEKRDCATKEMLQFVMKRIKYPAIAKENGIVGRVIIQFVVEKDGRVTQAKVVRDIGGGCGAEALRVVKEMPTWVPGKQRSIPVRVRFTLPVKFGLN